MPYDPQLGMTVYDPLEAYRSGQPAAQAFSSAYENAPQRQAQILRMQEILEEQRLRQQGMRNYTSEYNNLLAKGKTPLEASVQAFVGNAHYFSKDFGKALGTFENSAIREKLGEVSNLIRQQNADTLSDRLDYDIAAKKRALDLQEKHYQDVKDIANQRFDTQMTLGVLGSKDKSAALASREKIAAQNIVSKEGIAQRTLEEKQREFDQPKPTTTQREREDAARYMRQIRDLTILSNENPNRGDIKKLLDEAKTNLELWNQQHPGGLETTITVGPQGTEVKRTRIGGAGAQPGALTTANTTAAQNTLDQSLRSIDTAEHLLPLIGPDTFGPRAYAEGWINDKVLANAFPQLASKKRATVEQLVSELRETAIKTRKSDSNITQREVDQILRAVPETNTPINSPQNAINVTKALQKEAATRVLLTAKKLRVPIPPGATRPLEDTDLVRLAEVGLITAQEADSIRRNRQQP